MVRFTVEDHPLIIRKKACARGVGISPGNEGDHEQAPSDDTYDREIAHQAFCVAQATSLDPEP